MLAIGFAQVFADSARYLRDNGWQRGAMGEDGGPRCIGGALMSTLKATTTAEVDDFLRSAQVWRPLGQAEPAGCPLRCTLMNYNDLVATGPGDAIELLEGLALQYELQQVAASGAAAAEQTETERELVTA